MWPYSLVVYEQTILFRPVPGVSLGHFQDIHFNGANVIFSQLPTIGGLYCYHFVAELSPYLSKSLWSAYVCCVSCLSSCQSIVMPSCFTDEPCHVIMCYWRVIMSSNHVVSSCHVIIRTGIWWLLVAESLCAVGYMPKCCIDFTQQVSGLSD